MAAAFGVQLTDCGPNRLAVLAKARPLSGWSLKEVKAAAVHRTPLVVALDVSRSAAESLAAEFRRLGAAVEVFVSIPCPSDCCGHRRGAEPAVAADRSPTRS